LEGEEEGELPERRKTKHTLQSHNITPRTLHHLRNHIINQTMFIPNSLGLKLPLIILLENLLEDILKPAIIFLQNRILGAHIQRQILAQSQLETRVCEPGNRFISIVLCLGYPAAVGEIKDFDLAGLAALGCEYHAQFAGPGDHSVFGPVLIPEGVAPDDDGFFPAGHQARDAWDYDGFAEDGAAQVVADSAIGGEPHCCLFGLTFCCFPFCKRGRNGQDGGRCLAMW
jgi:hypothetical protein